MDGQLSYGSKRNFNFYSIGVTSSSLAKRYINKFIFTDNKLDAAYRYDWVNNRERFCHGLNPVILPRM